MDDRACVCERVSPSGADSVPEKPVARRCRPGGGASGLMEQLQRGALWGRETRAGRCVCLPSPPLPATHPLQQQEQGSGEGTGSAGCLPYPFWWCWLSLPFLVLGTFAF